MLVFMGSLVDWAVGFLFVFSKTIHIDVPIFKMYLKGARILHIEKEYFRNTVLLIVNFEFTGWV